MLIIFPVFLFIGAYVINIALSGQCLKDNGESPFKSLIPLWADVTLARKAQADKHLRKIVIGKILLFILAIVFVIADIYYLEYSKVYIGSDEPGVVEEIGGPYWIPMYIMAADYVAMIIILFVINTSRYRIRKKLSEQ